MRRVLMFLAATALMVGSAAATDKVAIGIGISQSCAAWTLQRTTADSVTARLMQQWVVGYMTGANAALPDDEDLLHGLDFDAVMGRMDEFCRANPQQDLTSAANMVALDLVERLGH